MRQFDHLMSQEWTCVDQERNQIRPVGINSTPLLVIERDVYRMYIK